MKYSTCIRAAALALLCVVVHPLYAAPGDFDDSAPLPAFMNPCLGHLTRTADLVMTMAADQQELLFETDAAPVTTYSPYFAVAPGCTRRVIEIRVPTNASSGCDDCYMNAEIHACAGTFPGSKSFETICRVPTSGTSEAMCKTFRHKIEVFKRPAGATAFDITPLKTFIYKGFIDSNGQCRVAATYLGQIHDTSEVYPWVVPNPLGQERYRVLSYPVYNGNVLKTELSVGYESYER